MSSTDKPQQKPNEACLAKEEAEILDYISICLASRLIKQVFVEVAGEDYVIELAGRWTLARFPLAGRSKYDIYHVLSEGEAKHRKEREAEGRSRKGAA